jgi:flagellar basal body P-ring protein FlgI
MPSLNKAKEMARTIVCQTNLKGLGTGGDAYAIANGGLLVSSLTYKTTDEGDVRANYSKYSWVYAPVDIKTKNRFRRSGKQWKHRKSTICIKKASFILMLLISAFIAAEVDKTTFQKFFDYRPSQRRTGFYGSTYKSRGIILPKQSQINARLKVMFLWKKTTQGLQC